MTTSKFSNSAYPSRYNRYYNHDLFDEMFGRSHSSLANARLGTPPVNIKEDVDQFVVELATPGLKKEDLSISVDNGVLTISSVQKEEQEDDYSRKEFSYASFSRSFTLPDTVDGDAIAARYEYGVLAVSIPKREEDKPKPKMEIAIS